MAFASGLAVRYKRFPRLSYTCLSKQAVFQDKTRIERPNETERQEGREREWKEGFSKKKETIETRRERANLLRERLTEVDLGEGHLQQKEAGRTPKQGIEGEDTDVGWGSVIAWKKDVILRGVVQHTFENKTYF